MSAASASIRDAAGAELGPEQRLLGEVAVFIGYGGGGGVPVHLPHCGVRQHGGARQGGG